MPNSSCGPWLADDVVFGVNSGTVLREAESKASDYEAAKRRHHVRQAWYAWGVCWALLNKALVYTDERKQEDVRRERAELFMISVDAFVRAHVAAVGTTEGLYMHILHAHVPDQIIRWGDLRVRQTQGLEHAHKTQGLEHTAPEQRCVKWTSCCRATGPVLASIYSWAKHASMTSMVEAARARKLSLPLMPFCVRVRRGTGMLVLAIWTCVRSSSSLFWAGTFALLILSRSSQQRASTSHRCRWSQLDLYLQAYLPAANPKSSRNVPSRPIVHVCIV